MSAPQDIAERRKIMYLRMPISPCLIAYFIGKKGFDFVEEPAHALELYVYTTVLSTMLCVEFNESLSSAPVAY
jgi:hypothetical protein